MVSQFPLYENRKESTEGQALPICIHERGRLNQLSAALTHTNKRNTKKAYLTTTLMSSITIR